MNDDNDAPDGPGLAAVLSAVILSFVLVTGAGLFVADINSTQAVLIGGVSSVVAAIAATRSGRRAARS
ncbi:hypothetical protein GRS48_03695 [Halorubrum sp. JWXQ-INN 858]|uniref:hypothetical protein n=1 Tax=Halorubrum sp. JWXQ-INN 858 TaxID=2690782 RepID=UPI00135BC703|nr:hypothetical protein [Halorubrum sp. JWXQ-INN 858]MWV63929.1 hypothetical protein [Halorubrum sp. JWXQ-INN 858]